MLDSSKVQKLKIGNNNVETDVGEKFDSNGLRCWWLIRRRAPTSSRCPPKFFSPTSQNYHQNIFNKFSLILNYLIKTSNNCFFVWLSNFCPLEVPSYQNLNLLIVCRTNPTRFWASILNSRPMTILQPAFISAQEISILENKNF